VQISVEVAITNKKDYMKLCLGCEGKGSIVKGNCYRLIDPKGNCESNYIQQWIKSNLYPNPQKGNGLIFPYK
jgi:hypothetical protein